MKTVRYLVISLLFLLVQAVDASFTVDWTSEQTNSLGTAFTLHLSVDSDGAFRLDSVDDVPAGVLFTVSGRTGIPSLAGKSFSLTFSSPNGGEFRVQSSAGNYRIGINGSGSQNQWRFDLPAEVARITAGLSQVDSAIALKLMSYERLNSVTNFVIGLKGSDGAEVFAATNATQFDSIAPLLSGGGTDWFEFRAAEGSAGGWGSLVFEFGIKDAYATPLKPASIFSDGCVLQRDKPVPVWGTSEPGETVTVSVKDQTRTAVADAAGNWRVELNPEPAGGAYRMTVSGARSTAVAMNVWFGDVWLLTGQSNMYLVLRSHVSMYSNYYANPAPNAADDFDSVRFAIVAVIEADAPQSDVVMDQAWSRWQEDKLGAMSSTGYFFARALRTALDQNGLGGVPLGFIKVCKGATSAEQWVSAGALTAMSEPLIPADGISASGYYNGMIAPIKEYAVKGALWYQGEGNARTIERAQQYPLLMRTLIESWRAEKGGDAFPFYFVQLAPFMRYTPVPADHDADRTYAGWAWMRESQTACLAVTNTGMACIIDSGFQNQIHPPYKDRVGDRLARLVLNDTYGIPTVSRGPVVRDIQFAGKDVIITFNETAAGLETRDVDGQLDSEETDGGLPPVSASAAELAGFALCGADQVFYWATSAEIISTNQVRISCADVPSPVAVRYAWQSYPRCNLYNSAGLPAEPFRSDSFPYRSSSGAENRKADSGLFVTLRAL